ncbi:MAG: hypothetical protein MZV70_13765 [Desulfobacterales bacterium]|nr:hypothetical protein [Desulfobacterales bacterium]
MVSSLDVPDSPRHLRPLYFLQDGRGAPEGRVGPFPVDHAGEIFGLVGESGCGKSVTALSVLRILPQPAGRIVEGRDPVQ